MTRRYCVTVLTSLTLRVGMCTYDPTLLRYGTDFMTLRVGMRTYDPTLRDGTDFIDTVSNSSGRRVLRPGRWRAPVFRRSRRVWKGCCGGYREQPQFSTSAVDALPALFEYRAFQIRRVLHPKGFGLPTSPQPSSLNDCESLGLQREEPKQPRWR